MQPSSTPSHVSFCSHKHDEKHGKHDEKTQKGDRLDHDAEKERNRTLVYNATVMLQRGTGYTFFLVEDQIKQTHEIKVALACSTFLTEHPLECTKGEHPPSAHATP